MLDTIVLKLHRLDLHQGIVARLSQIFSHSGGTLGSVEYNPNAYPLDADFPNHPLVANEVTGEVVPSNIRLQPASGIARYYDTNRVVKFSHYGDIELPSCHYSVAFQINYQKDYVNFNLSIPKYYYGTNLFQFVEHFTSSQFDFTKNQRFDYNARMTFRRLQAFIKNFFNLNFPNSPVNFQFLEVARLDLCYNQIFPTMDDALAYLDSARLIKKKYLRKESTLIANTHNKNIMYVTSLYSAKIYHKGEEFAKHDKKELRRIYDAQTLDHLQGFADRILRYEITFRSSYMSYLFMHNVARVDCPIHHCRKQYFDFCKKKIELYNLPEERLAGKGFFDRSQVGYKKSHSEFYSAYTRFVSKRVKFMVAGETAFFNRTPARIRDGWTTDISPTWEKKKAYLKDTSDLTELRVNTAVFGEKLLNCMFGVFWDFINQFKIDQKSPFVDAISRLQNYNDLQAKNGGKQVNINKYKPFLLALDGGKSFDELCVLFSLSRATKYRYLEVMKFAGIDRKNVHGSPVVWKGDFVDYHTWYRENYRLFFIMGK